VQVQMQQMFMGSPWQVSLKPLAVLLLMALVSGGLGGLRLLRAARAPVPA
jgi:ABC-2 type transport system permease protein